jgi:hypothetical protein
MFEPEGKKRVLLNKKMHGLLYYNRAKVPVSILRRFLQNGQHVPASPT